MQSPDQRKLPPTWIAIPRGSPAIFDREGAPGLVIAPMNLDVALSARAAGIAAALATG